MSFKRILVLLFAVLLIIFGGYTVNLSVKGPGEIEAHSGALTLLEGAEDPDFDIYVDSPVLVRKVEMYQYVRSGNSVTTDFSEKPEGSHDVKGIAGEERLTNPKFPEEPKAEIFCGKVSIGTDGLLLDKELVRAFGQNSYVNFQTQVKQLPVRGMEDGGTVFGLNPLDDYTYATPGGENWNVGDLRVTWYAVDPADFAEVYTAVGFVDKANGVIGDKDHVADLFDRKVSLEKYRSEFSTGNRWTGILLIAAGVLIGFICLLPVLKKN